MNQKQDLKVQVEKENQIDIRDVYKEKVKSAKTNTVNWVKRYGYWALVFVLFLLSLLLATVTVGDVYRRTNLTEEDVISRYSASGRIISDYDKIVISDLITEAQSKNEIISFKEYDKFVETISSYNYTHDGVEIRFDSLSFYLFEKEAQQIINFTNLPQWRIILMITNSILGILIIIVCMYTGLQDAQATRLIINAKDELRQASTKAARHRLRSEQYFSNLHKTQLEAIRRAELSSNGLIYEDYFDSEGRHLINNVTDEIKPIIQKALNFTIAKLSFDDISTNTTTSMKNINHLKGLKEYATHTAIKSIVAKSIIVIFFTFVSVSLIITSQSGWQIIMNIISTIVMFVAGVLEYLNAYAYVIDEYSETIQSKIRHLESFIAYVTDTIENEKSTLEKGVVDNDTR